MRKRIGTWLMAALTTLTAGAQDIKIMVLANPNVMAPELLIKEGSAFDQSSSKYPLLYRESSQIFEAITDTIHKYQPTLVLIPGDLTKSGEWLSHQRVVRVLEKLLEDGYPTLVIPGDQDYDNPTGVYYDGDTTTPAEGISAEQFAELYKNFGYGNTSDRDPHTLSYVCEPIDGLVIFGIDLHQTDGILEEETQQWMFEHADKAIEEGKQVVAMLHPNAMEHFNKQSELSAGIVVQDWQQVGSAFVEHGIRLVFTGHQHVQDVATYYTTEQRTDSIIDVATGSLALYPNPWRIIDVNKDLTAWRGWTGYMRELPGIGDVQAVSRETFMIGFSSTAQQLIFDNWEKIKGILDDHQTAVKLVHLEDCDTPEELSELVIKYFGDLLKEVIFAHLEGNEPRTGKTGDDLKKEFEDAAWQLLTDQLSWYEYVNRTVYFLAVKELCEDVLYPGMYSIISDENNYGTPKACLIDDLNPFIRLPRSEKRFDAVQDIRASETEDTPYYTLDGRCLPTPPTRKGIYIYQGKKHLRY